MIPSLLVDTREPPAILCRFGHHGTGGTPGTVVQFPVRPAGGGSTSIGSSSCGGRSTSVDPTPFSGGLTSTGLAESLR